MTGDIASMNMNGGWWGLYPPPNYYYYYTPPIPTGWICPRCGMVNAPYACICYGCSNPHQYTITATTACWSGNTKQSNPFYYTGDCGCDGTGV